MTKVLFEMTYLPYGNYTGPSLKQITIMTKEELEEFRKEIEGVKIKCFIGEDIEIDYDKIIFSIFSEDIDFINKFEDTIGNNYGSFDFLHTLDDLDD
jgi:hypothetical protein